MKNVERYFVNTLSDLFSQNSIDILLGKHVHSQNQPTQLRSFLDLEMKRREDLYTQVKNIKLQVCTWNLCGTLPPENKEEIEKWILPFNRDFEPDIIVIGFQEIVELNPK